MEVTDKDFTPRIVGDMQRALSERVPGAVIDVNQLQTNPVQYPLRSADRKGISTGLVCSWFTSMTAPGTRSLSARCMSPRCVG